MKNSGFTRLLKWCSLPLVCLFAHSAFANPCDGGVDVDVLAVGPGLGGTGAPSEPGVGGTGRIAEPGLGGTGRSAEPGLGGTGLIPGTALGGSGSSVSGVTNDTFVYGVITGFASICVNGVEIEYDNRTPVLSNGQPSSVGVLKQGQWVVVRAAGVGRELTAKFIAVDQPIGGPVTGIDKAGNSIEVMGQLVKFSRELAGSELPKLGELVAVSGLRLPSGEILSTRVDPLPKDALPFVSGQLSEKGRVAGIQIEISQEVTSKLVRPDQEVRVKGRWDGQKLRDVDVSPHDSHVSPSPGSNFHIQTVVSSDGRLAAPLGVELRDLNTRIDTSRAMGKVAVLRGQVGRDGRANVELVEMLPSDQMLRRGGAVERSDDRRSDKNRFRDKEGDEGRDRDDDSDGRKGERDEKSFERSERESNQDDDSRIDSQAGNEDSRNQTTQSLQRVYGGEDLSDDKLDRNKRLKRLERTESTDGRRGSNRLERQESPRTSDKFERMDRVEKQEKAERLERLEREERPGKAERPEKVERPEKAERPEKVERPERIERPDD